MIKTENLSKSFGDKTVFDGANIDLPDGCVCGLIGINGAGKSTLLRILSGVLRADRGCVKIDGGDVYDNGNVKKRLFFLPDDPFYDSNINVKKLKELYATFYGFDEKLYSEMIGKFGLPQDKPIRNFSKGMRRQAFVAAAFACRADYLFLDEAFDGLDPLCRIEFKRGVIEAKERGATVIIASHSLRELEDICDSFILIDKSSVKCCGSLADALDNIFKIQFVVNGEFDSADLPFKPIRFTKVGKLVTVVAHGDKKKALADIAALNPLFAEEIPMDFEDMFIEEISNRGYVE